MSGQRRRERRQRTANRAATRANQPQRSSPGRGGWRGFIDSIGGFTVVGSVAGALLIVALLIFLNRPGSTVSNEPYEPIERSQVDGRVEGDPNAPVRIVMFADFQCPFCADFSHEVEPTIREEFIDTGVASLEFRHVAFLGAESTRAAEAAECANLQNRFWDYHDLLFLRQGRQNSGVFSESNLIRFGEELAETSAPGTWDQAAFEGCVQSGETRAEVASQTAAGTELLTSVFGQATTPSFSINGEFVRGLNDVQVFRDAIARAQED